MHFATTEEETALREAAERFARERLRPREREHEAAGAYDPALAHDYAAAGYARLEQPEELGGAGMDLARAVPIWSALAAGDPAAPLALAPWWPGATALAAAGVDVARTRGALVWARSAAGEISWLPRATGDALVLIDDDGVGLVETPRRLPVAGRPCGLRACGQTRCELTGAAIRRLGGPELACELLTAGRIFVSALLLGAARDAHAAAAAYAQERVAFGRPIAHHQGLAFQLADAATALDAADLLLEAAARSLRPFDVAQAHVLAIDTALGVGERSVQALGGHGYLQDHRVEKRLRDARSLAALWGGRALAERDAADGVLTAPSPMDFA